MKMPRPVPTLVGQMVTLRALDPEKDAADHYEMNLEPEMHLWTGGRVLDSVDDARKDLERLAGLENFTIWAIIDNAQSKFVGRFFIHLEQRGEMLAAGEGNRIAKPYWRKGHNREARRLVFEYVFRTLNADLIETACWTVNTNSRLSILAHGFTEVEPTVEFNPKYSSEMPMSHFVLAREEWEALQSC